MDRCLTIKSLPLANTETATVLSGITTSGCHELASGCGIKESTQNVYVSATENAKEFIRKNFTKRIVVNEIARNSFLSQYHFTRIFKKHTLYSPYQYLVHIRLQHAKKLIRSTEFSITEISFQCGFSSIDYFSAAFSKKYKISPSRYKKMNLH